MLDAVLTVVDARHVTQHLDDVKPEGVVNEAGGVCAMVGAGVGVGVAGARANLSILLV